MELMPTNTFKTQKKIYYMNTNEEYIIDEYTFTQLQLMSNVVACCIEKNDYTQTIFFHNSIDKNIIHEIIVFINDTETYGSRLETFSKQELFRLLNGCYYLDIKDMIEVLTNKIVSDIKYMNKSELENYF
jgi:hypothetical protein